MTHLSSTSATRSRLAMSFERKGAPRTNNKFQRKFTGVLQQLVHKRERKAAIDSIRRDPLIPKVESIVNAAVDRKAGNIIVLRIAEWTEVADYLIIMEGNSKAQLQAIEASIEERLAESFQETPYVKDGTAASGWMVLDYSDILVHIMTPTTRAFYRLEQRWKDCDVYPIDHLLPPAPASAVSTATSVDEDSDEHFSDIVEGGYNETDAEDDDDDVDDDDITTGAAALRDESDPFWA